jgi:hypothetical protein
MEATLFYWNSVAVAIAAADGKVTTKEVETRMGGVDLLVPVESAPTIMEQTKRTSRVRIDTLLDRDVCR